MNDKAHVQTPMPDEIRANAIIGTEIYDLLGEKLGPIDDIILSKSSAKIEYGILNFGGRVVGINQRYYKLPWRLLRFDETHGRLVFNANREKLERAPTCELSGAGVWLDEAADDGGNAVPL